MSQSSCVNTNDFSIKVHLFNAQSICNILDLLCVYIDHYKPSVVAITETWDREPLIDSRVAPEGYTCTLFRKDRLNNRLGGCVRLLVRDELSPTAFTIPGPIDNFDDSVWCVIRISSVKSTLVGCVYRSPTSDVTNNENLQALLDYVSDAGHDYRLILGDFNLESACRDQAFLDSVLSNSLT